MKYHPTIIQLKQLAAAYRTHVTELEFNTKLHIYNEIMMNNQDVNKMFGDPKPDYTEIVKKIISLAE